MCLISLCLSTTSSVRASSRMMVFCSEVKASAVTGVTGVTGVERVTDVAGTYGAVTRAWGVSESPAASLNLAYGVSRSRRTR